MRFRWDSEPRRRRAPRRFDRVRNIVGWLLTIGILAAMAWLLLPARFGGPVNYVVVRGTSMEPTFHVGDMLYVREQATYQVGDVIVYRIPDGAPGAGVQVVHRLVEIRPDGTFTLRGDNRDRADLDHPGPGDVVGAVWQNLGPHPTRFYRTLPLLLSLVLGIAVAVMLWPAGSDEDDDDDEDDLEDDLEPYVVTRVPEPLEIPEGWLTALHRLRPDTSPDVGGWEDDEEVVGSPRSVFDATWEPSEAPRPS